MKIHFRKDIKDTEIKTGIVAFTGADFYITLDGDKVYFDQVIAKNSRGGAKPGAGRKSRKELGLDPVKQIYGYVPEPILEKAAQLHGGSISSLIVKLIEEFVNGEQGG